VAKLDLSKPLDRLRFINSIRKALKGGWKVEFKKYRGNKTIPQLKYYRKVLAIYGGHFGSSPDESARDLKEMFGLAYRKGGFWYIVSVADMNTKQLSDFINKIRRHSMEQGKYIELPEEYLTNQFQIDKDLEINENYNG